MKALVLTATKTLEFQDAPDPKPSNSDCVVGVQAVGICGSDMHGYLGHDDRRPPPIILGHEAAGEVIAGPGEGRRVTINPLIACGTCDLCQQGRENICRNRELLSLPPRNGAFAEQVRVPEANLVEVPENIPLAKAALAEPLAVCWHAVRIATEIAWVDVAQRANVVIGGGAIGFGTALALRAFGATDIRIVETNDKRAAYLREVESFEVITPAEVDPASVPHIFDAVGYGATRTLASEAVTPGGVICHIGLGDADGGFDIRRATLQEITFLGSYCYTMKDFQATAQAIFDGRFGALDWTEHRSLADGNQAFDDLLNGRVAAPKIVLRP